MDQTIQTKEVVFLYNDREKIEEEINKILEKEKEKIREALRDHFNVCNISIDEIETAVYEYVMENFRDFEIFLYEYLTKVYKDIGINIEAEINKVIEFKDKFRVIFGLIIPNQIDERELYNNTYLYPIVLLPNESDDGYYKVLMRQDHLMSFYHYVDIKKKKIKDIKKFKEKYKKGNKITIKVIGLYKKTYLF